jgi:hypothetical protein
VVRALVVAGQAQVGQVVEVELAVGPERAVVVEVVSEGVVAAVA